MMKAKELIEILKEHPDMEVRVCNSDNPIDTEEIDIVRKTEMYQEDSDEFIPVFSIEPVHPID